MTIYRKQLGGAGEKMAAQYLIKLGYKIIAMNWVWKNGELDIVAQDGETLVFVEVKTFGDDYWAGGPAMNMTPKKIKKVIRGAQAWLARRSISNLYCRFDVVAVWKEENKVEHLPGAFVEGT